MEEVRIWKATSNGRLGNLQQQGFVCGLVKLIEWVLPARCGVGFCAKTNRQAPASVRALNFIADNTSK